MKRFGTLLLSDIVRESLSGDEFAREVIEDLLNFLIKLRLWRWRYLISLNKKDYLESSDLMILIKEEKRGINRLFSLMYSTDLPVESKIEVLSLIKEFVKEEINWIMMDTRDIENKVIKR